MSFGSPVALLALLVLPATLAFAVSVRRGRSRNALAFTNLDLLASLAEPRRNWRPWVPLALLLLALALAAGALAQPHVNRSTRVDNATVVLLVDVSGSMRATDVEPTRLDAATAAIRRFLDRLPPHFKVGLVQFSTEPDVLARPTHDRARVRAALTYLHPEAGTAIGDALAMAANLVQRSLAEDGIQPAPGKHVPGAIVLISDGTQSAGKLPPDRGATFARDAGIRVDTVALGTADGLVTVPPSTVLLPAPPDPPLMRSIAQETDGRTFTAHSASRLGAVFGGLGSSIGRETRSRDVTSWFAFAGAIVLIAAIAVGRVLAGPLS
jgi:Ca-activated chloride channel family protein